MRRCVKLVETIRELIFKVFFMCNRHALSEYPLPVKSTLDTSAH